MPIDQTLRFANAAAALSCTRPGAISSVPTLAEVNALVTGTGLGP
jgi:sugar/nucleoside kinase (ribokinase family)